MPIQEISLGIVANDGEGNPLREGGEKINQNFTDPSNAASYEVGKESGQVPRNDDLGTAAQANTGTGASEVPTNDDLPTFGTAAESNTGNGATDVPTNSNLSASIVGTATLSGDTYTFSPSGAGFRPLEEGMYLSFRLPSGSSNSTTTPDIGYNGTNYTIRWIDGSVLEAGDLNQNHNKQPVLFYFNGIYMLIASDISGSNADGNWCNRVDGTATRARYTESAAIACDNASGNIFASIELGGSGISKSITEVLSSSVFIETDNTAGTSRWAMSGGSLAGLLRFPYYRVADTISSTANVNISQLVEGRWY